MKKLATTFGLLALMLIVTSFTTPSEIGGKNTPGDLGTGGFNIGGKNTPGDLGTGGTGLGGKNIGTSL